MNWLTVYLVGAIVSIVFGLRAIGVFRNDVKFGTKDLVLVIVTSLIFHWFAAMVFVCGYSKPQEGHPDVI